ncbi:hypothetical protein D6779_00655, partial [Candidatus Parcubacteria bacterium]
MTDNARYAAQEILKKIKESDSIEGGIDNAAEPVVKGIYEISETGRVQDSDARGRGGAGEGRQMGGNILPGAGISRRIRLVKTGEIPTGITRIVSTADAAHLSAPLRKGGQETFAAIVTDKDGNVLNVIRHSTGTKGNAPVDIQALIGAIASIPSADSVYLTHNHPGGTARLSAGDKRLAERIAEKLHPIGVGVRDMIAVTPDGKFASAKYGSDKNIKPAARRERVPEMERRFGGGSGGGVYVGNPDDLMRATDSLNPNEEPGILIANHVGNVVRFVPMSRAEMRSLRSENAAGAKKLLTAIHETNGGRLFAVLDKLDEDAVRNIARFASMYEVEFPDSYVLGRDRTQREAGEHVSNQGQPHVFFSRTSSEDVIEPPAHVVRWMGFDKLKVRANFADLAERHPEYYASADDVRRDAEFVLQKPENWYPHADGRITLVRESERGDVPGVRIDFRFEKNGAVRIASVYRLTKRGLVKKMKQKKVAVDALSQTGDARQHIADRVDPGQLSIAVYLRMQRQAKDDGSQLPSSPS